MRNFERYLGVFALLLGWPLVSYSQDSAEGSKIEELEVITVTATRRETDIMDTPIAITALTQEFLEKEGLNNIKDLSYAMPALSIQNTDTNAPIITLRGVRSTNVTEVGDPAVGIHVDGIYVPRPQGASALMFDLERAELMRGPQGTLFGRNSIVGTLNIVTAKPDFNEQGGSVTINGGRYDELGIRAHYNLPISDNFALRFAGMTQQRDSYLNGYYDGSQVDMRWLPDGVVSQFQPVTDQSQLRTSTDYQWYLGCQVWQEGCWYDPGWQIGLPQTKVKADSDDFYNNVDNHAYRLSARWAISDDTELNLQYEMYQDDGAGWQNQYSCELMDNRSGYMQGDPAVYEANTCEDIMGTDDRYTVFVNVPGKIDMEIQSFRAVLEHDFGSLSMKAKYGHQRLEQYSQWDTDGGANPGWDMAFVINDYVAESDVLDIELKNDDGDRLNWVLGAFYMKEDNDMEAFFHATQNGDHIFRQPNREIESSAIFGQLTYSLSENLFLTLGARYSRDEKSDDGGRVYDCVVWNSCYPSTEVWGQRFLFPETLNALAPDFHVAGNQIAGVDCEGQGGPYGGGPYLGGTGCMVEVAQNDVSESYSNVDWRIGLDWDISPTSFVYGYVATGYKSGSIADQYTRGDNTVHPDGPGSKVSTSYDEEDALTIELGYKGRLLDGRMNLSANYYHTTYDGKQFTGNIPVDVIRTTEFDRDLGEVVEAQQVVTIWGTQNFGEQVIQGIEIEWDWIPYEGGKLSGWATFMDTEITDDFVTQWFYGMDAQFGRPYDQAIANVPENAVNLEGNETPFSPDIAITVRFEHQFNLGKWGTLTPSVSHHWQSEDYVSIWNADKHVNDPGGWGTGFSGNGDYVDLPGYFRDDPDAFGDQRDSWHMTDVTITYKPAGDHDWYIQAYGYNVTDEEVVWWRGVEAGNPRGSYSAPAQYGVRFGYHW